MQSIGILGAVALSLLVGGLGHGSVRRQHEEQTRLSCRRASTPGGPAPAALTTCWRTIATWTITGHSAASKTYPSKQAFLGEVIRPFNARMSVGLKPVIRDIYADGNTVIVFFDASGTARDGKPYANTYAWFLEMREGKVARATAFFDSVVFNDFWQRVQPAVTK